MKVFNESLRHPCSPCQGCPDRFREITPVIRDCHMECARFSAYEKERIAYGEALRAKKEKDRPTIDFIRKSKERINRRQKTNGKSKRY